MHIINTKGSGDRVAFTCSTADSELKLKVICVIGNSTIFLLVASFVMEKNKL